MYKKQKFGSCALFLTSAFLCSSKAQSTGLVVFAAEKGIGKFHRQDNKVHPHSNTNAWKPYVLPDNADLSQATLTYENADHSVTIFYSSLEEMLMTAKSVADARKEKIEIINLNAHGMPGGMWFPKDPQDRESKACKSWRDAAQGSDEDNYKQYYSPVSKNQIFQMRMISNLPAGHYGCVTGLNEWKEIISKHLDLKSSFADNFQLHLLSCVVGLGSVGDAYTKGIADLLLASSNGRVETSMKFGLGDWSMDEGMGFWDYLNDAQLDHDNERYPIDRKDRDLMQAGDIRVASLDGKGASISGFIKNADFMLLSTDVREFSTAPEVFQIAKEGAELPSEVILPGTKFKVELIK